MTTTQNVWHKNSIQFPRLLCEIMATQDLDFVVLAESMDLSVDAVQELFDRANYQWETSKQAMVELVPLQKATASSFVSEVAGLGIWGHTKSNGEPYSECDEPADGFTDSHTCLMQLIEVARHIANGEAS